MSHCPFDTEDQLCDELKLLGGKLERQYEQTLPGCPRIPLDDPDVGNYLCKELHTTELNEFEPYMFLMAKQDSTHISSLTEQIVRGRNIVITEKPRLHLVWAYNRVFIKPLPIYLMSRPFWDHFLLADHPRITRAVQKELREAINGLIRSYFFLIQHESDFAIAQDDRARLLPKEVSYAKFAKFTKLFNDQLCDDDVSPRFHFGELRLTRLNFWFKLFHFRINYSKVEWQYNAYIARFYAPILFIFSIFSVTLGAMQVILAAKDSEYKGSVAYFGFSLFILYFVLAIMAFLFIIIVSLLCRELIFAIKDLTRKRK